MTTVVAAQGTAVHVQGVVKTFGRGRGHTVALGGLDLVVPAGQFVCLLGRSGCGKSTLLNLLAGLDEPTAGSVDVGRRRVAMMFQDATLFPWLTAGGNVALALKLADVPRTERPARVTELLESVHLGGLEHKRPHELSGGMRQRVALARALAQDASVLLMDEPFGALDAMTRDVERARWFTDRLQTQRSGGEGERPPSGRPHSLVEGLANARCRRCCPGGMAARRLVGLPAQLCVAASTDGGPGVARTTAGSRAVACDRHTMRRAAVGFALSIVVGTGLGLAVARVRILRAAVGSLITGLQTKPSIAWFPLTILLFGFTEQAILFVVVLGAAPSVANGLISGIDDLPPQLMRAARVLGARGVTLYTAIVMPAVLPTYLAGLKQGWAFAWRSLMAGELLVIIAKQPSLGNDLTFAREFANAPRLIAVMIIILIIGMIVDAIFSAIANGVRRRRGLGALRL